MNIHSAIDFGSNSIETERILFW